MEEQGREGFRLAARHTDEVKKNMSKRVELVELAPLFCVALA